MDVKVNENVANNAPGKRGILITEQNGEHVMVMRGTANAADVLADAKIIGMMDYMADHQREAQQTWEMARSQVGAIKTITGHSLGGNLSTDLANNNATPQVPIKNVILNGAISIPQATNKAARSGMARSCCYPSRR